MCVQQTSQDKAASLPCCHRLWDDSRYPPREVQGFYRKAELETLIRRRTQRQSLASATV